MGFNIVRQARPNPHLAEFGSDLAAQINVFIPGRNQKDVDHTITTSLEIEGRDGSNEFRRTVPFEIRPKIPRAMALIPPN